MDRIPVLTRRMTLRLRSFGALTGVVWVGGFAGADVWTRLPTAAGFSWNAGVSVAVLATAILHQAIDRRAVAVRMPMWLWLTTVWFLARLVGAADVVVAAQQVIVWCLFVGALVYASTRDSVLARIAIVRVVVVVAAAWAVVALLGALPGLPTWASRPTSALMAVGFVAAFSTALHSRRRVHWVVVAIVIAGLVVSEARTAALAAVVGAAVVWWCAWFRWRVVFFGRFTAMLLVTAVFLGAVASTTPLGSRVTSVLANLVVIVTDPEGGIARSVTQGRSAVWVGLMARARQAPVLGQGLGAASAASHELTGSESWRHPHNDYLRVLYDTGTIGLGMFMLTLIALLRRAAGDARRAGPRSGIRGASAGAAIGALTVILLLMVTDNVIVYSYVMVPAGLLVGQARAGSFPSSRR